MPIEPELPAMVAASQIGRFTGLLYHYVAPVRTYITDAMNIILLIAGEQQRFIEIILQKSKRVTIARFGHQIRITYKLPAAGKQFFPGLFKYRGICIKISMQCFGPGNIRIYIKTRHAAKLIR